MKKLYYSSLCLDNEINLLKSNTEGGVIAYQNDSGDVERCELYTTRKLSHVVYFSPWPSKEILDKHSEKYPDCKFEIQSELASSVGKKIVRRYMCTSKGKLEFLIEEIMDSKGDIIRENRFDNKLEFIGALEYEYDDEGDIILTREISQNFDIIREDESI